MQSQEPTQAAEAADIRDYLRPILTRWPLIALLVVVVTALTYYYYDSKPTFYAASTSIWLKSSTGLEVLPGTQILVGDPDRVATSRVRLFQTADVARRAARKLGYRGNPANLLGSATATSEEGSDFLTITGTSQHPADAPRLANAFADAFIADQAARLSAEARKGRIAAQRELAALPTGREHAEQRDTLQDTIERLRLVESVPGNQLQQLDPAIGAYPMKPATVRNALFALAISLLFGIAMAYGLELFDRRLRRLADVEPVYDMPVLAQVPHARQPLPKSNGQVTMANEITEAFRTLRVNLQLSATLKRDAHGHASRTLLVTSSVAGEGKSTVVRNLAIAYREAGMSVAVIDADLRGPTLPYRFGVQPRPGLVEVLTGSASLEDALQVVDVDPRRVQSVREVLTSNGSSEKTRPGSLSVLPAGTRPSDPAAVLASERFRALVDRVASAHDIVLLDSSPILPVSDAIPLMSDVDGVIVVTRLRLTTRDAARRLAATLRRVPDAEILGVVVNFTEHGDEDFYGYGYPPPELTSEPRVLSARS